MNKFIKRFGEDLTVVLFVSGCLLAMSLVVTTLLYGIGSIVEVLINFFHD
tara:strand:- start:1568 stop:1717 length:150 start_codon:yes stop_codon:yes gene_type:complete